MKVSDCPRWDDRTAFALLECIGGPWDGSTCPIAPRIRTIRAPQWGESYYEVQAVREQYRLVWHGNGGMLWTTLPTEAAP